MSRCMITGCTNITTKFLFTKEDWEELEADPKWLFSQVVPWCDHHYTHLSVVYFKTFGYTVLTKDELTVMKVLYA